MKDLLIMRPHHGLCINFFIGKGYSENFVKTMTKIIIELNQNSKQKITLQCRTDAICFACPHNNESLCESAKKVLEYDKKCLELCNIQENTILTWEEFQKSIHKNILIPGKLSQICGDCQWSSICNKT